ncbi:MAG: hypothetical protein EOO33_18280, partial [Comamonadaceae bacterium]
MPLRRTLWIVLGSAAVLAAGAAIAFAWWLPSDEELAQRASAAATQALGVPVVVGQLQWSLWPQPGVVLQDVRTEQAEPFTARRIVAQARWAQLLGQRRLAITHLALHDATVPQVSLSGLQVQQDGDGGAKAAPSLPLGLQLAEVPVEHAVWTDVRWVTRRGRSLAYSGDVDFAAQWRPRRGAIERAGAEPLPVRLEIERKAPDADLWLARVTAGGRTEEGELRLQQTGELYRITGTVDFTGVDVVGLLAAFERKSVVAGKARGRTELVAEGADLAKAARSLQTRTRFTVERARLLTFDLERAVKSAGQEHRGTTQLDSLTGTVQTQGDPQGTIVRYGNLKATSGALTATGEAVVQDQQVSGNVAVDLVDGVVGVPLQFSGPMSDPSLSLPPAAAAGAAVGTVIA